MLICSSQHLFAKSNVHTTISLLSEEIVALRSQLNNLKQDTNLKFHRYETEIELLKAENKRLIEQNKQISKEIISTTIDEVLDEKLSKVTENLTETINHKMEKQNSKFENVVGKVDNFITAQEKLNKAFKQEKLDVIKTSNALYNFCTYEQKLV